MSAPLRIGKQAITAARQLGALRGTGRAYAPTMMVADHSGTLNDGFVIGPCEGFRRAYEGIGVDTQFAWWRRNMGFAKPMQIAIENAAPDSELRKLDKGVGPSKVREAFIAAKGRPPTDADTEEIVRIFNVVQNEALVDEDDTGRKCTTLLPGAKEMVEKARSMGIQAVGGTTGFPRENCDVLRAGMEEQGLFLDTFVAPDDLGGNLGLRPQRWMLTQNMMNVGLDPDTSSHLVVKIDDMPGGVGEGNHPANNFRTWTVLILDYGSNMYIDSWRQYEQLMAGGEEGAKEWETRRRFALHKGVAAQPHFVVAKPPDVIAALTKIKELADAGVMPQDVTDTELMGDVYDLAVQDGKVVEPVASLGE